MRGKVSYRGSATTKFSNSGQMSGGRNLTPKSQRAVGATTSYTSSRTRPSATSTKGSRLSAKTKTELKAAKATGNYSAAQMKAMRTALRGGKSETKGAKLAVKAIGRKSVVAQTKRSVTRKNAAKGR